MKRILDVTLMAALLVFASPHAVAAQTYPERPLRFIIPFSPGGGADTSARIVTRKMVVSLGQQIVIDNRGGAGGNVAAKLAAEAPADGYTLLYSNVGSTISTTLYRELPYNLLKDFAPVSLLMTTPFALVINPSVPAQSLRELIALAKSKPGDLTFASSGYGGPSHMAAELFKAAAGLNIRHVPYKGAGPAARDVVAGRVNMQFGSVAATKAFVDSGRMRALAIAATRRSPILPDVPTASEAGLPGFETGTWFGVSVPTGAPPAVIKRLHAEFVAALNAPEVRVALEKLAFELVGNSPEEYGAFLRKEIAKYAKVIRDQNIRLQ